MKSPWEIEAAIIDLKRRREAIMANIEFWEKEDRKMRDAATRELLKPDDERDFSIINQFGNAYHGARESLELEYSENEAKIKTLQWVLTL